MGQLGECKGILAQLKKTSCNPTPPAQLHSLVEWILFCQEHPEK